MSLSERFSIKPKLLTVSIRLHLCSRIFGTINCTENILLLNHKKEGQKNLTKYFKTLVLVLNFLLLTGTAISPKFCEKHQEDDYC